MPTKLALQSWPLSVVGTRRLLWKVAHQTHGVAGPRPTIRMCGHYDTHHIRAQTLHPSEGVPRAVDIQCPLTVSLLDLGRCILGKGDNSHKKAQQVQANNK